MRLQEKQSELFTTSLIHAKKLDSTEKWCTGLQKQIDEARLMASKVQEIGERQERIGKLQDKHELQTEYNQNHYTLIENFVEKYIPIQVQDAISQNLRCFLSKDDAEQHGFFEKTRSKELHAVILDDDGMPNVITKMNEVREKLNKLPYPKGPEQFFELQV